MMLPLTSCCIEASPLTCFWMLRYSTSWKEENVAVQELDNSDLESLAFCSGKSMMRPNVNTGRHHHKCVSMHGSEFADVHVYMHSCMDVYMHICVYVYLLECVLT